MNIFYLDKDPVKAAQLQYNKHVVKMILESAQMLCTIHRHFGNEDVPYKSTHKNHPSTKWARENWSHYNWLYQHMIALGDEYTKRYGKTHLTIQKCVPVLEKIPLGIKLDNSFEQPPQCMPDQYKNECSVKAYWNYYIGEKHTVANTKTEKIYQHN
jgi:hypothetical protein